MGAVYSLFWRCLCFDFRALIAESCIKVIETDRSELLPRKHSRSLEKALEELDLHQVMLKENSTFSMNLEPSEILVCVSWPDLLEFVITEWNHACLTWFSYVSLHLWKALWNVHLHLIRNKSWRKWRYGNKYPHKTLLQIVILLVTVIIVILSVIQWLHIWAFCSKPELVCTLLSHASDSDSLSLCAWYLQ